MALSRCMTISPTENHLAQPRNSRGTLSPSNGRMNRRSCYAYFSTAFTRQLYEGMERKIKTGEPDRSLERRIIQKCRRSHWPERLRYCPDCAREDMERYGETYWHRMSQLPGVEYCLKHGTPIRDSEVTFRQITMAFCPASHALQCLPLQEDAEKKKYRQRYLAIAGDTEWLLRNGLKLEGCRNIARKYKELFMEKGSRLLSPSLSA